MAWLICALAIGGLAGCGKSDAPDEGLIPAASAPDSCISGGRLAVEAYGGIDAKIDWSSADMVCEGMPRPADQGARLRFAGQIETDDAEQHLAFILSIPNLVEGATGEEMPTRVTIIEEDAGRFFSTRESEVCWANIERQAPRSDFRGVVIPRHYEIGGIVYCVAPVAELNGSGSVTLSDLAFSGSLSWARKK